MSGGIAIVGMACRYPDARSPRELWEVVLAQRRAFRRIPDVRLRLRDYWSQDREAIDRTYVTDAAVLTDVDFDRARYHVSAASYRAADPAHWIALDCATAALADAGWTSAHDLQTASIGVLVGNTLTGDYSRAAAMRLRWPYVERAVALALERTDLLPQTRREIVDCIGEAYRAPLPEVDGETLAGWLSNTIAGRICNHFDFHGGGYVVDGACASSLLAIANACTALSAGDLDVALAGGVDLSLDPLELVGFARAGALAVNGMFVYGKEAEGFWPGEGCGFLVLMREAEARAQDRRVYAVIRGWGVSSDGKGGLTRPEVAGQSLAVERAYARAGYGIDTVGYFEGHGTATRIGDQVELAVLANARRRAGARRPAAIGSIKANIGHTKAAAGVAGVIKAAMAVHRQVLPPITACDHPRDELAGPQRQLEPMRIPAPWPKDVPLRASVSAMGFGGINAHLTLENPERRRVRLNSSERACLRSEQDCELVVLSATDPAALLSQVEELTQRTRTLSRAELIDLALESQRLIQRGIYRAAVVARDARTLRAALDRVAAALQDGQPLFDSDVGAFLGLGSSRPRVAFMFPGQGSPLNWNGGRWARRFATARACYRGVGTEPIDTDTRAAQPAIARAAIAGLRVIRWLGIDADVAFGHSLGELVALHWAGAIDEPGLMRIIGARADAMAACPGTGAMASLAADATRVGALVAGSPVCIAACNTASQTVVAGPATDVSRLVAEARREGTDATLLPVSHAFHSELMRPAVPALRAAVERERLRPVLRRVHSTVTAHDVSPDEEAGDLLARQLVEPVRFYDVARRVICESDLAIEVGPGTVLTRLMRECGHPAALSLDAGGESLAPLIQTVAGLFAAGAPVNLARLATRRFARPFRKNAPRFLQSPCESPHAEDDLLAALPPSEVRRSAPQSEPTISQPSDRGDLAPLDIALDVVAQRADLPASTIGAQHRLLTDLHFNSITAADIVLEIASRLAVEPPVSPTEFADASIAEIVEALTAASSADWQPVNRAAGVDSWVRAFQMSRRPAPRRAGAVKPSGTTWHISAPDDHPLRRSLESEVAARPGGGVIVCMPSVPDDSDWVRLTATAREAVNRVAHEPFVIVHDGEAGAGLGATLAQECAALTVVVVQVPFDAPLASRWVLDEAAAADRFTHVCLTENGSRYSPQLELATLDGAGTDLTADDVLVVSGGGKGIAAECALALARATGASLGIIGRADPADDPGLAETLSRFSASGVRFRYERADVADRNAATSAVRRIAAALGPVSGILHAAGINRPALLEQMSDEDVRAVLDAKLKGVHNLIEASDVRDLRLCVAFGSLIARTGMRGEGHYALANEALRLYLHRFGTANPVCRCLTMEWSVWAGTGMGQRLQRLEALERQGIAPLTIAQGVESFLDLILRSGSAGSVIVTGRFGHPPALPLAGPPLPLGRFLHDVRVWYPQIELVADTDLSVDTDTYLDDHVLQNERLFPAVMGLEAMVQAAAALVGAQPGTACRLEDVRFEQPIIVPAGGRRAVRVAALAGDQGEVHVVLRSNATAFAVDHFSLRCRFETDLTDKSVHRPATDGKVADAHELYADLLFQRGCFRRVAGYRHLRARSAVAEISPAAREPYFGTYLGQSLWLGDPGVRDAVIHSIQACVPLRRLVPVAVESVAVLGDSSVGCTVHAVERSQQDAVYIYDVLVRDPSGRIVEQWDGLHLREIGPATFHDGMPGVLLEPWLEREWLDAVGDAADVVQLPIDGTGAGLLALRTMDDEVFRRSDGYPEPAAPGRFASATHDGGTTIGVLATAPVGCDLEYVKDRSVAEWTRLLGAADAAVASYVAETLAERFECAATRLWSAREALRKCDASRTTPLILSICDGPVARFRAGGHSVATARLWISGREAVFAVVAHPHSAAA